jgi:hypothetical protein
MSGHPINMSGHSVPVTILNDFKLCPRFRDCEAIINTSLAPPSRLRSYPASEVRLLLSLGEYFQNHIFAICRKELGSPPPILEQCTQDCNVGKALR